MKQNTPHKQRILEERLRAERPSFRPSAGFTDRVLAAVPSHPGRAEQTNFCFPWFRLMTGLATLTALVFLLLQVLPPSPAVLPPVTVTQSRPVAETPPLVIPEFIPELPVEKLEAFTAKLDEPLEKELKNVISDTRLAIQFVASNFLPEN